LLTACASLNSDLLGDSTINLALPIKLLLGKIAFEARLNQEVVFIVVDETQFSSMLNNVKICIRIWIFCDAFKSIKKVACVDSNELRTLIDL